MLGLATYNVLNLFDPRDAGEEAVLDAKLQFLAARIAEANADVVGLQEIGSEALLAQLVSLLESHAPYMHCVVGTPDSRGIRNALLSRLPLLASRVLTTPALDFPRFVTTDPAPYGTNLPLRRGIVHATVDAGALGPVDVLVVHFKSGRGVPLRTPSGDLVLPTTARDFGEANVRAMIWRAGEALFVRGAVDALFAAGKSNVAVMGDFNDVWDSVPVRIVRGGGPAVLHATGILIAPETRFTVLHNGDKKMIDHILLSSALRDRVESARVLNAELHDHDVALTDAPRADSDHALVVLSLG